MGSTLPVSGGIGGRGTAVREHYFLFGVTANEIFLNPESFTVS